MRSSAVAESHMPGETYEEFTARVARDQAAVDRKLSKLSKFTPSCASCGETCNPEESGTTCKRNGMTMASRWARELAQREWYSLGHFGGSWSSEVRNLACLLDRVRAGALDTRKG